MKIKKNDTPGESENKYRMIIENAGEAIFIAQGGKLKFVNPALVRLSGYEKAELLGQPFERFIDPADRELVRDRHLRRLQGDEIPPVYTIRVLNRQGRVFTVHLSSVPVEWEGKPATLNFLTDVTERERLLENLRVSEEKFRTLFEHSPDGLLLIAEDGRFLDCNEEAVKLLGYDAKKDILGKTPGDLSPPFQGDGSPSGPKGMELLHEASRVRNLCFEWTHRKKDGKDIRMEVLLTPLPREKEGKQVVYCDWRDISSRKEAEEALKQSEERFRTLIETTLDLVFIVDRRGFFTYVNPKFEIALGYSLRELMGKAFTLFVAPEKVEQTIERFRNGISGKATPAYIAELLHKSGHRVPVEFVVTTLYDQKEKPLGRFGVGRDVSDKMKVAQEMERSHEELRALAKRLQEIREEERTTIARDLHDDLGQTLTALKMEIAWLSREMGHGSGPPPWETFFQRIDSMRNLVDGTMKTARRIMMSLRPGILDELGLNAAIEWQVNEFTERTGIPCRLETGEKEIHPDGERSTALFRILQECLTNVSRHAGEVTQVVVRLFLKGETIHLEVEDNGRGIKEKEIKGLRSLGILGMRERTAIFRGKVTLTGGPGGTKVDIRVPFQ